MAHSILGDEEERDNLFDFDIGKFLHDYSGRVVNEVRSALNQIETERQVTTLPGPGTLRLATAPFAPAFQTLYRQAGDVLAPFVNRLSQPSAQAFIDIQNRFAEQRGLPQREYEPITGEQLAAPIAAAGSLLRGKFPTWFSPARRAVTTAPQQRGDLNYWLGRFKQEKGATSEAKQLGLLSTQGEATESLLGASETGSGTLTKEQALNLIEPIELVETVLQYPTLSDEFIEGVVQEGPDYSLPQHADNETINLPGGTNPKEILVQLPFPKLSDFDSRKAYDEAVREQDLKGGLYTAGHYDEPNVLVHIRVNERDVGGKKTLHIEEIQSDWHQQGQKKGYRVLTEAEVADVKEEYQKLVAEYQRRETNIVTRLNTESIRNRGALLTSSEIEEKVRQDVELREIYEKLTVANDRLESTAKLNRGVPDAPYKKTWHELGWKRAFIEALRDPSIERLTWTTGDVQADRYDLSKQVEAIRANLNSDGTYQIGVQPIDGNMQKYGTEVPVEKLSELVGKELAAKIVAEVKTPGVDSGKVFSGLDLKVGGEFHKNLYDKKIPQFVKKFLKQFGVEPQRIQGKEYWEIFDIQTGKFVNFFDTEEEAKRHVEWVNEATPGYPKDYRSRIENNEDLWYIDPTPEMRETYAEGVPLAMREDEEGLLGRYA